jgi:hypothetical protein
MIIKHLLQLLLLRKSCRRKPAAAALLRSSAAAKAKAKVDQNLGVSKTEAT